MSNEVIERAKSAPKQSNIPKNMESQSSVSYVDHLTHSITGVINQGIIQGQHLLDTAITSGSGLADNMMTTGIQAGLLLTDGISSISSLLGGILFGSSKSPGGSSTQRSAA